MTFNVGDRVRARRMNPPGHTRLPAYLRGCTGRIERTIGAFPFSDKRALGEAATPSQMLYTVCFDAAEVWGPGADRGTICADLFESYLELAR